MSLVDVASMWIGEELSWLEQLCLKSFVDVGHRTTLFTYGKVEGIPEGVHVEPASSVFASDKIIRHARTGSPAYHADIFRLHLIKNNDVIWVDTDAYCVKPFIRPDNGHYHGWISDDIKQINNGVLGLPKSSKTLAAMLKFTADEYPIPPWYTAKKQSDLRALKASGKGIHVSLLPWGVWGPNALTHYLHDTGEVKYTQPKDVIYPVPFSRKRALLKPNHRYRVEEWVTENTTSIHFWGRRFRSAVSETGGIPPKGSYTADLLEKHDIDPRPTAHLMKSVLSSTTKNKSLIPELSVRKARQILSKIDVEKISSIADISGNAYAILIAAYQKFSCRIDLIAIGQSGEIGTKDPHYISNINSTKAKLIAAGVPAGNIRIVDDASDLDVYQVVNALNRWSYDSKVKHIEMFLKQTLHASGKLLIDIKKGSGGYPFLREFGNCQKIEQWKDDDTSVDRVILDVEPQESGSSSVKWGKVANKLIGKNGFFRETTNHSLTYIKRNKTLCVTFDNLDVAMNNREDRKPWGFKFIEDQNWSMLAVMAHGWTWYRDEWVFNQFDEFNNSGFFHQFDRVIFYGASMGGYGALVFSRACPDAEVVVFSPQTILDRSIVPWETRYRVAWDYDYSGNYGDAANTTHSANRVSIFFDPYSKLDVRHIERLSGGNIDHYRAPFFGHRLGSMFSQMGILQPIVLAVMNGQLSQSDFHRALRQRRDFRRYRKEMIDNLIDRERYAWAAGLSRRFLKEGPDNYFSKTLERINAEIGK